MSSIAAESVHLKNLWDRTKAQSLDPVERLVYRSNLLGSDPRITNFGGGNTSAKIQQPDPLTGESIDVLWVKGSGGDLGTIKRSGFASLYLNRILSLEALKNQEGMQEDDVIPLYSHCTFGLNPTACSIDTPLHAFVPKRHVDHMHPDAVIAIAASENSEELTKEAFGGEVGFLPWKRPGFDLGLQLRDLLAANPNLKGVVMGKHGLINWADDEQECYELTLDLINKAQQFIDSRKSSIHPFGNLTSNSPPAAWSDFLPELRGMVEYNGQRLIAHIDEAPEVHEFLSGSKMKSLAALGTSCPDHFLRTKIWPMILNAATPDGMFTALEHFRENYAAYYERCKRPTSPDIRNPNPSVILVPGLGMVTFGKTKQESIVTSEFYRRAIEVMRGAETMSKYSALPEQEAFDIEYWSLEEAKLKRMPPEREFSRQVAVVTGGAQGIGKATAKHLASMGACVVLLDINADKLADAESDVAQSAGTPLNVLAVQCDVTNEKSLSSAFEQSILKFGGVDICVVSAGNARRGTVADTSDEDYDFQSDLLMKAYFSTMRAASKIMIRQGTGGAIVVVASKNGVAVGSNAAVYSAAKAFELHLMRTTASDLAKSGIRANAVNPDAVLQGSGIWDDKWRTQTAANLGIEPNQLEEHYRKRSMLGVTVSTDDVAEAICWLASEKRSSRTTGCTIPVDGGIREGFLR